MGNPPVMVCSDCKEYFEVGVVGEEAWAKKHITHNIGVVPENTVSGWFSEFKDMAIREPKGKKEIFCPKCGQWLRDVDDTTETRDYIYSLFACDQCHVIWDIKENKRRNWVILSEVINEPKKD